MNETKQQTDKQKTHHIHILCHVGPNLIDENVTFDFSGSRVSFFLLCIAELECLQATFPNGLHSYD